MVYFDERFNPTAMSTTLPTTGHRLVFLGKQQVKFEEFEIKAPAKGEVLVQTHKTLMSTGTENIVLNRLFDPGTHWDNWVKYPFYPGYLSVGHVIAVGPDVTNVKVNDRVASRSSHSSYTTLSSVDVYPIPFALPDENAVWFGLAKITWHGANAAQYHLGDSVLIVGAGPIGQMSIRWARAAGATSIIVVDAVANRMKYAQAGGATATITAAIGEAREAILAANQGIPPHIVIDSTGNAAVFSSALTLARNHGRVVILGDTGTPASQHLTNDVITRGLHIVGAHDCHNTEEWNTATISNLIFNLAVSGRYPLDGLNSHTFTPDQCEEAYATANRDRANTMGIIFDWTK